MSNELNFKNAKEKNGMNLIFFLTGLWSADAPVLSADRTPALWKENHTKRNGSDLFIEKQTDQIL